MKKMFLIFTIVLLGISVNAKSKKYTIFCGAFQECVTEHIHNAQDSVNKVKYDVWHIPMDSVYYVTVLPNEFISLFKDDVYGMIHDKDIDLSTPLKKKLFERTERYAKYDSLFHIIQKHTLNHAIHYWDKVETNYKLSYRQYDLDRGGFLFHFNPPFSTYVPSKFSHSFIRKDTFIAKVNNLDVASLIEDSYGKNNDFIICYLIQHHSSEPPKGYTLSMSTENSHYSSTSPSFYFELLDIQLIHQDSKRIIWSLTLGDLSNTVNGDALK